MTFCHLNLKTDRSLMRGLIKPARLVEWCKAHGVRGAAVTDYTTMAAIPELYKACKGTNVKPIYGMTLNVVPDKTKKVTGGARLILIAKNRVGFRNLITLATLGSMYFYYLPRVSEDDLGKYNDGLIAITGDLYGIAAQKFFAAGDAGFANVSKELSALYGDDVYYEMQPVPSDTQRVYNEALVRAVNDGVVTNLVITGDPHYLTAEDKELHISVLTIKNWRNAGWQYPFKGNYHVRTRDEIVAEMADLHGYDVSYVRGFKQAFDSPDEIIDKVEVFDIREGVKIPSVR